MLIKISIQVSFLLFICYASTKTGAVEIKEEGGADRLLSIVKKATSFSKSIKFLLGGGGWPVIHSSPQCVLSLSPSYVIVLYGSVVSLAMSNFLKGNCINC